MSNVAGIAGIPVYPDTFPLNETQNDVRSGITYSQSQINSLKVEVLRIIENMSNIAQGFKPDVLKEKLKGVEVRKVNFPKQRIENLILDAVLPAYPVKPNFEDPGLIKFDVRLPQPPEGFRGTYLEWAGSRYGSELGSSVVSYLLQQFAAQKFGLPGSVVDAMRIREARQIDTESAAAKRNAFYRFAFTGQRVFAAEGIEVELEKARQLAKLSVNEKIIEEEFKAYLQDKQVCLSVSVDLEKINSDRWNWFEQRDFESKSKSIDFAIAISEHKLKEYVEQISAEIKKWELEAKRIDAISTLNSSRASIYESDARVFQSIVSATSENNMAKAKAFEAKANANYTAVQAASAENETNIKIADFELRQEIAIFESKLKELGYSLDGKKSYADLSSEVLKAQVQPLVQLIASAFGLLNFSAGESYGTSIGSSHSHSTNIGYSESVSFSPA